MSECSYVCFCATYAHFWIGFSIIFIISHRISASGILHNVLKSNQPIKWSVIDNLFPQKWNEKASLIGWEGFMVCSISNPDNQIATKLGSKTITNNRIATMVISVTGSHLLIIEQNYSSLQS